FDCVQISICFLNDPPTTESYTLSLHDALPICLGVAGQVVQQVLGTEPRRRQEHPREPVERGGVRRHLPAQVGAYPGLGPGPGGLDRKSTRLNSSHVKISYAVFCLKKKNNISLC